MTHPARFAVIALLAVCGLTASRVSGTDLSPDAARNHAPAPATKPVPQNAPAHAPANGPAGASGSTGSAKNAAPAAALKLQPLSAKPAAEAKPPTAAEAEPEAPSANKVLKMLAEGNARWVKNETIDPNTDPDRRAATASGGQKPIATILTCSDSRLPIERMFDRGVGELFVVRVAGNVVGSEMAGTVEYGLGHLHTPVLIVMGHTKCGAVAATVSNADVHGHIKTIINEIRPAADRARRQNPSAPEADLVSAAVRENVWQSIYDLLKASDEVRRLVSEGEITIVGAVADIATGKVEFMGEHPWQSELLSSLNHTKTDQAPAEPAKPEADQHAEAPEAKNPHGH